MKKYIALVVTALLFVSAAVANPVADTVIVYDTVYNYIHDTVPIHIDTDHVTVEVQREYTFSEVIVAANFSYRGAAAGNGLFPDSTMIELGAVAKKGYKFMRWQDGNRENPRQVMVKGNTIYTAIFDTITADAKSAKSFADENDSTVYDTIPFPIEIRDTTWIYDTLYIHDTVWIDTNMFWDVIVLSGNESKGKVSGNGYFLQGTEVEIAAIPAENHRFVFWHDRVKDNPRKVKVEEIEIFVAEFATDTTHSEEPDDPEDPLEKPFEPKVVMDCDGLTMSITCPANATIRIFTPNGRLLCQSDGTGDKHDNTVRPFQMPQAGFYLVQVGHFPVRKVALQDGYHHKL